MSKSLHPVQQKRLMVALPIGLILFVIILLQGFGKVNAQDGKSLVWGEVALEQVVGPEGSLFNFQATAGDIVQIEVQGIGNFQPVVLVQDINRTTLGREDNAAGAGNVSLSQTIFNDGLYYIQVLGVNNGTGQFTILLNRSLPIGLPLVTGSPTEGIVGPDLNTVYYDFEAIPSQSAILEVRSLTDGYAPQLTVYLENGEVVASLSSKVLKASSLEFGPSSDQYKLAVELGDYTDTATVRVSLNYVDGDNIATSPVNTPISGCLISTQRGEGVNVRSGGSTNHPGIAQLFPGQNVSATGYSNLNDGWYEVVLNDGRVGWVASFVVDLAGDCASLPSKTFAAAPPTATHQPQQNSPTPAATATGPTSTPSATSGGPAAPPDSDFNITLDMNGNTNGFFESSVSYPNGDTEDRIFYNVTGLNSNQSLPGGQATIFFTVSCDGTGSQHIQFINRGQTYGCGNTWSHTATFDSNSGNVTIRAVGGTDTYVNWSLIVNAHPAN